MSVNRINGHDAAHALEELRKAKAHCANALYMAGRYLQLADSLKQAHLLPYELPSEKPIAEALDAINRDLNKTPETTT